MSANKINPLRKYIRRFDGQEKLPHFFCSGCGAGQVLNYYLQALDKLGMDPGKMVTIGGVGCTARIPVYINTDVLHGVHGRTLAWAMGVKLTKPEIPVVIFAGDGDLASIGGNHFIHAARRNLDVTVICVNNLNFAMTGGQVAPTTPLNMHTMTTPSGNAEPRFDLCELAKAAGATHVERWTTAQPAQCTAAMQRALQHKGFSLIEIISQCPTHYGRYALRTGDPVKLMEWIESQTVTQKQAQGLSAQELGDKLMVKLADAVPVIVETDPQTFQLDIEAIKKAVTGKTRAVMINTPNNPTGAVYSRESLLALGELAVEHDFYVISDEVYEKLVYKGEHVCIASLSEEIYRHSIVVNGFSKAFAMTGWRIGYSASPADIARGMASLQGHTTSNSTTFVQWAAVEALQGGEETIEAMRVQFDERRKYLLGRLRNMPGLSTPEADGAFYLLPDVSSYYGKQGHGFVVKDSFDFCKYLLDEARLAVVPGAAFEAPKTIRIAYSNSLENIKLGMDRMEAALTKLQ